MTTLVPFYREYDLPWEGDPESSSRFRKILRVMLILLVVFGILFPLLPTPKRTAAETEVPQRLARVMIEQPKPPPPPPPPKVEEKPKVQPDTKTVPVPKPVDQKQLAHEKAQKTVNQFKDELADLRQQMDLTPLSQTKNLSGAVGADSHAERALITSKVGAGSGGITSANSSRGFGTGAGSLTGHETTGVTSTIARGGLDSRGPTRTGTSGKAARSREEIELVFDRNKGAIYSLYGRELRDKPELQGKIVLEFTIAPSGEITMCRVVSSELNDPDLERKIIARVRLFHFDAKDVEPITTTKPIDFFRMNLNSEIEFFSELRLLDKARLLNLFLHEIAEEGRSTYGPGTEQVHDGAHLRFVNELMHRLTRVIEQLLAEDATRPADDVVLRMLLAPRADKVAERLVFNAYSRAIQGFESYDTTILMNS